MITNRPSDVSSAADVYTDLSGLQSINVTAHTDKRQALKDLSKQFESMMMSMMMKSMRQANDVFSEDNPLVGKDEKFYRDMFDQQLSLDLGKSGSIGIAESMFRQLEKTLPVEKSTTENANTNMTGMLNGVTKRNIQQKTFAELVNPSLRTVNRSIRAQDSFDTVDQTHEVVKAGDIFNEDKFSEIDLWLEPSAAKTVDVASVSSLSDQIAEPKSFDFDGSPERFIEQLYSQAQKAAGVLGVKPEVLLAQAGLETGWGKKLLTKQDGESSFNLFNIKATKKWDGDFVTVPTLEYRDGIAVKEQSAFRSYKNPQESFSDYIDLISGNPIYQRALQNADDPKRYVRELQRAGYATDPNYAKKIIDIMNSDSMKKTLSLNTDAIVSSGQG
jgi:flagellar protein FlgJ